MKTSNLALRLETDEPDTPRVASHTPLRDELAAAAHRLAHTRSLGLVYRAIVIYDDGLRPFRVR